MNQPDILDLDQTNYSICWDECHGSSVPEGMMDVQVEWLNDRYFVIFKEQVVVRNAAELYMYTPQSDTWDKLNCQVPVYNFAVTTYQSRLVLVGGRMWSDNLLIFKNGKWVEACSSMSDKILELKDGVWIETDHKLPTKRRSPSVVCDGENLIVAGGCDDDGPLADVDVYNGTSWKSAQPLPEPCYLMKSILHNGKWYLMGGLCPGDIRQRRQVYCTSLQALVATSNVAAESSVWNRLPDTPYEYSSPAIFGNRLIITGPNRSIIHALSDKPNSWVFVGHLPEVLSQNCTIVLPSGELMVIGKERGPCSSYKMFKGFLMRAHDQSSEDQVQILKRELSNFKERCASLQAQNTQLKSEKESLKSEIERLKDNRPASPQQAPPQKLDLNRDHAKVVFYLELLEDEQLRSLGQALGLHYTKLQRMKNVCREMVASWLREEDDVLAVSGPPTIDSLSKGLIKIGQTGMALRLI